nr:uncharacterized protein LOC109401937 [Aedes albopictus]
MDGLQGMARLKELELNIDCRQIAVPCSSSLQKLVINGKTNGFNFYGGLAQSLPNTTELCINTEDETWNDDCLRAICTTMTNIRRLTIYHAIGESVTDMSYRYIGNLRQLEYFCLKTDPTAFVYGLAPNDLNFSNWVSLVWASEIHLSGFHKIDQNQLLCFLKNPKLRRLTLELCVLEDDARKLLREHEMTVPRPLPHIACDGWR